VFYLVPTDIYFTTRAKKSQATGCEFLKYMEDITMRFLLINVSALQDGLTKRMLIEAEEVFTNNHCEATVIDLGCAPRHSCLACGRCRTSGKCILGDLSELVEAISRSDGVIFATPTHYASATGTLISVMSRICFSAGHIFEHKPVSTFAVARRAGAVCALEEINRFFSFTSAITVNGIYPPHLYGGERDTEGLAYARSVAENMIWIARCIETAAANGVEPFKKIAAARVNI
jgi:multimeric flavodoxin WrbA